MKPATHPRPKNDYLTERSTGASFQNWRLVHQDVALVREDIGAQSGVVVCHWRGDSEEAQIHWQWAISLDAGLVLTLDRSKGYVRDWVMSELEVLSIINSSGLGRVNEIDLISQLPTTTRLDGHRKSGALYALFGPDARYTLICGRRAGRSVSLPNAAGDSRLSQAYALAGGDFVVHSVNVRGLQPLGGYEINHYASEKDLARGPDALTSIAAWRLGDPLILGTRGGEPIVHKASRDNESICLRLFPDETAIFEVRNADGCKDFAIRSVQQLICITGQEAEYIALYESIGLAMLAICEDSDFYMAPAMAHQRVVLPRTGRLPVVFTGAAIMNLYDICSDGGRVTKTIYESRSGEIYIATELGDQRDVAKFSCPLDANMSLHPDVRVTAWERLGRQMGSARLPELIAPPKEGA